MITQTIDIPKLLPWSEPKRITTRKFDAAHYKRFLLKFNRGGPDDCWCWTASKNLMGYGKFSVKRRTVASHRIAFELWKGPIPEGLQVLHSCDNPRCINPKHLFLGTQKDNIQDCIAKGRYRPPEEEGHPRARFTKAEIIIIRQRALKETRRSIAQEFKVSTQAIDKIVNRITWRRVW